MKLNKIQSAYIKNKPSYNYELLDQDKVLVAKGHLLSAKQKQLILKHIKTEIVNGQPTQTIDSYVDFSAAWILASIDWWIIEQPIEMNTIHNLDQSVIAWFVDQIQKKNTQSIDLVTQNRKN